MDFKRHRSSGGVNRRQTGGEEPLSSPSNFMVEEILPNLTIDLSIEILSRLPAISLSQCRWVCKSWYILINQDPNFASIHHAKSIQRNYESLVFGGSLINHQDIDNPRYFTSFCYSDATPVYPVLRGCGIPCNYIGSCNGLLCFKARHHHYLSNPVTGQKILLPYFPWTSRVWVSGFGFNPDTNHYKLVHIVTNKGSDLNVKVLTIGLDRCWRTGPNIPYSFLFMKWNNGTYFRGSLHWLSCKSSLPSVVLLIISFDMETAKFGEIPLPSNLELKKSSWDLTKKSSWDLRYLRVFGESIAFINIDSCYTRIEVWVLKEYGVRGSWNRQYIIKNDVFIGESNVWPYLVKVMHNGDILFQFECGKLIYYDPIKKKGKFVSVKKLCFCSNSSVLHLDSLISPRNIAALQTRYEKSA